MKNYNENFYVDLFLAIRLMWRAIRVFDFNESFEKYVRILLP